MIVARRRVRVRRMRASIYRKRRPLGACAAPSPTWSSCRSSWRG